MSKAISMTFWILSGINVLAILTMFKLSLIPKIFIFIFIFLIFYFATKYINASLLRMYSVLFTIITVGSIAVYLFSLNQFNAAKLNYMQNRSEYLYDKMMDYQAIKNVSMFICFNSVLYIVFVILYKIKTKKIQEN